MTHAYREIYLSKAQAILGDAFDYAVNACDMNGTTFTKLFCASTVSRRMENGEPACVAGKSGTEIVLEIISETMGKSLSAEPHEHMGRSREYWIGWAAAYYQWHSGRKYSDIFKVIPFEDMQKMYYTLHEADITKFVEIADQLMKDHFTETNLKRIRTAYSCTHTELAKHSGVSPCLRVVTSIRGLTFPYASIVAISHHIP